LALTHVPAEAAVEIDHWLGGGNWLAEPLAGDASVRSYFRVHRSNGQTFILAYYPPLVREGLGRFLNAYDALCGVVPVPAVLEHGESTVLQQDVGNLSLALLFERDKTAAIERYREAAALLATFDGAGEAGRSVNPAFDQAKFLEELDMTRRFYVEELAGGDGRRLEEPFSRLAERLTAHPYTLCHRDFHGHNLFLFNRQLYVIDYQDMRMGPDMYDLASLLRDRGVWKGIGPELESVLVAARAEVLCEELSVVRRRYLEALLQRSIKAIGTFARLVVVNGRRRYLAYIGTTLETVRECAHELDEWQDLTALFPFEFENR
jgi:hypothetical protein